MKDVVSEINCIRVTGDERDNKLEVIAIEKEMQLIVNDQLVTSFLYSSGHDEQLVKGYLLSSGMMSGLDDIERIEMNENASRVWVSQREKHEISVQDAGLSISHKQLLDIRSTLLDNQKHHKASRGFHGALIWELTSGRWFVCEDIGRHNAVDKVIGHGLQESYDFASSLILLSGRLVSDIVSKCTTSGISLMGSMTVATDGGIKQATDSGMTLIGSLSEDGFWLYHEGDLRVI